MPRVLIVDDAPEFRGALRALLGGEPEIDIVGEAGDGDEAIALAVELNPDVVLMDVRMPVLNGFAATRRIRELVPEARVIALTAYDEHEVATTMIEAGASAYCLKGAPPEELIRTIAATCGRGHGEDGVLVRIFRDVVQLYHKEQAAVAQLTGTNRALTREVRHHAELTGGLALALAAAAETRAGCTVDHLERVSRWALLLTERFAPDLAHDPRIELGYLLHDIGLLGVPERILQKLGALDPEERARMQEHVEIGARLLDPIPDADPVGAIVLSHHERWDGTGYPAGLRGETIPLTARVFAVSDAFDAMTGQRPYRTPLGREEALAELEACAGTQFDPGITREFVLLAREGLPQAA
jgi:response regulator RpfG family c-di-GMP phosphodiesterase